MFNRSDAVEVGWSGGCPGLWVGGFAPSSRTDIRGGDCRARVRSRFLQESAARGHRRSACAPSKSPSVRLFDKAFPMLRLFVAFFGSNDVRAAGIAQSSINGFPSYSTAQQTLLTERSGESSVLHLKAPMQGQVGEVCARKASATNEGVCDPCLCGSRSNVLWATSPVCLLQRAEVVRLAKQAMVRGQQDARPLGEERLFGGCGLRKLFARRDWLVSLVTHVARLRPKQKVYESVRWAANKWLFRVQRPKHAEETARFAKARASRLERSSLSTSGRPQPPAHTHPQQRKERGIPAELFGSHSTPFPLSDGPMPRPASVPSQIDQPHPFLAKKDVGGFDSGADPLCMG